MRFRFSGTLLRFTEYQKEVSVDATTLKAGLDALVARFPDMSKVLYDRVGQLRATHRFFINGVQLEKDQIGHAVAETDIVDVVTAVTGGEGPQPELSSPSR